jgi:hypothetical protein
VYNVKSRNDEQDFDSLDLALEYARELGSFVTIAGAGMEIVGVFGVDSVRGGVCPDGVAYDWMKRRTQ